MPFQKEPVLSAAVSVLTVLYLAFQIRNKRWSAILSFCVIAAVLCGGSTLSFIPCGNWQVCVLVAIVASNVVSLPHLSRTETSAAAAGYETFESDSHETAVTTPAKTKATTKAPVTSAADDTADGTHGANESEEDDDDDDSEEEAASHSARKNAGTGTGKSKDKGKGADTTDETGEVDTFSTFMETYRSLTPDQIESMTTDTRALITTQQDLMQTVKSLSPVIAQGKEMMDTFKDYFGPGSTSDLLKAFKSAEDKP
jgi:hypothetical protein